MSSEKRTIKINPELFKVPDKNTSRKNREKSELKIKVKPERQLKNKSLRRSVLKMIREKQQEEYKKLFTNDEREKDEKKSNEINHFNKDFENSLEYFHSLVEKEKENEREQEKEIKNNTLKRYPEIHSIESSNFYNQISNDLPDVFNTIAPNNSPPIHINQPPRNTLLLQPPKYGCLKNGTLPTYRNYYNTTRRLQEPIVSSNNMQGGSIIHSSTSMPSVMPSTTPPSFPRHSSMPTVNTNSFLNTTNNYQKNEIKKDLSEKVQKFQKGGMDQGNKKYLKYLKRRKIYKRTYKIGRSKTKPQISVLVSNKTIRNRITTEAQMLKQTPIHEVRQYLVKKGFIKVGSLTPNDVLRKMYETVSLICGEVQNHNPENLLYNFMNDTEK